MEEVTCSHCSYKWIPRKKNPKSCPRCKQYIKSEPIIGWKAVHDIHRGAEERARIAHRKCK